MNHGLGARRERQFNTLKTDELFRINQMFIKLEPTNQTNRILISETARSI